MNNFIKQVIEEKFASKAQQKFFYAKANEKGASKKEKNKWSKMASEFSKKTDFKKIPDKKESDIDEIVDEVGNIKRSKKPANFDSKGITQKKTSDEVVQTAAGAMGSHSLGPFGGGQHGSGTALKYWAEADMSKALGYDDTLGNDEDYDDAKQHFKNELDIDGEEADDRLSQLGYDKKLPHDKVRLVENPKKYIEDFIETIIPKKNSQNDILAKENDEMVEISPIIKKQIKALKNTMKSHNIKVSDVVKHLQKDE
jgi:hypothetical protein